MVHCGLHGAIPAALFAVLCTTMLPSLICTIFGYLCSSVPLFGRGAVRCVVIPMRIVTPLPTVDLRCITLAGIIVCWLVLYCVLWFDHVPLVMPNPVSCHMSNIPASVKSAGRRILYGSTKVLRGFVAHGDCAPVCSHHVHLGSLPRQDDCGALHMMAMQRCLLTTSY